MSRTIRLAPSLVSLAITASAILPAAAELPTLGEKPLLGYYTGHVCNKYQFGVDANGKITLIPMAGRDLPMPNTSMIKIEVAIQETAPDGKVTTKQIIPASLSSPTPPSAKLSKTTITGKITGDATFELALEQQRDIISMGGRITNPGTTIKNPLSFSIRCTFPDVYAYSNPKGDKAVREFEKKVANDQLELTLGDKKRKKIKGDEKIGPENPELDGPGIAKAEVESAGFKGKKFLITTTPEASLKLWNAEAKPMHEGFVFVWTPDPAKDQKGAARVSFLIK